jgi:hypothetical protein
MSRRKKYPRASCVHEAGHGIVALNLFGGFAFVQVAAEGESLPTEEPSMGECRIGDDEEREYLHKAMFLLAGVVAQGRSMQCPPWMCAALYGGCDDWERAKAVCSEAGLEFDDVLRFTRQYIHRCWPEVRSLADRLQCSGIVFGREMQNPSRELA